MPEDRAKAPAVPELPLEPIVNPFINRSPPLNWYTGLQVAVAAVTLLPIRAILFVLTILVIWFFTGLSTLGLSREYLETHKMPTWRRALRAPMWALLRVLLFLLGFNWLEIEGEPAPRAKAPVVVANHTSLTDPLALMMACHGTPVSRAENEKIPLVGSVLRALQTIFVDRGGSKADRAVVREKIKERASKDDMPRVLIFPEATCTNGEAVITFKAGAFHPMRPVQLVAVTYPDASSTFDPCWVTGGPALPGILMGLMLRVHNRMRIRYLPPIEPPPPPAGSEFGSTEHAFAFARKAQLTLARVMGKPATKHSYYDVVLAGRAEKLRYKRIDAVVPEFGAMGSAMTLDIKEAKTALASFIAADRDHDGQVTRDEWVAMFREKGAAAAADEAGQERLLALFDMLDQNESGTLDFREFLLGVALLRGKVHGGLRETLRVVFRALAGSETATLDRSAFESLARQAFPGSSPAAAHAAFDEARGGAAAVDEAAFVEFFEGNEALVHEYREALLGEDTTE